MYKVMYTKLAVKDIEKLKTIGLSDKARKLIEIIKEDPYSRRINIKHV